MKYGPEITKIAENFGVITFGDKRSKSAYDAGLAHTCELVCRFIKAAEQEGYVLVRRLEGK